MSCVCIQGQSRETMERNPLSSAQDAWAPSGTIARNRQLRQRTLLRAGWVMARFYLEKSTEIWSWISNHIHYILRDAVIFFRVLSSTMVSWKGAWVNNHIHYWFTWIWYAPIPMLIYQISVNLVVYGAYIITAVWSCHKAFGQWK